MADDVNNIQIQQQLNKLLDDQKRILRENTRSLREQANLTQKMVESLGQANISNNVVEKSKNLKKSLKEASDEARTFSSTSRDMASAVSDALGDTDDGFEGLMNTYAKASGKAGKWGALTGGFIEGIGKGFNLLKTGLSGVLSLTGSVVQGMFSIGKSILAIPFKVFNAFVAEANRMQGEPLLAREFEETRKAFGDFGEDLSKHVIGGFRNLKGELADTGLNVYRVLGYRHEQLKFVREQFEALGATAHVFGLEIASQAEYFAAYQKGLGLSGEMMKGLAQATMGTGETFEETLRTTTNFTTSLGKQFGVSQKVIGRDVGEMAKDLKNFGSVGVRQMAQMSVYARKLGVDFKDLLGIVNQFDNFEDAAESAARLAQAFGLNIDAMEMINEQDPAARVDQLRKAFYATGKDITKLSRQERNYLATTAGIEDQALNAVFALDKQSMSYKDIQEAGQNAEQQQITQAEAMEKLSDSIERMIKSGRRTGGFFDRFMKGFRRGVRWSGEFRDVMYGIKRSLWATEIAGRKVGRMFIKAFPGVKQFLKGMSQLFDPQKFEKLGGKVTKAFGDFLDDLGDPARAKKALEKLLSSLKKAFFGMESDQRESMMNIIGGLRKTFGAIGQIILGAIKIAAKSVTKLFKAITKVIKGDSTFPEAIKEAFGAAGQTGANALLDIWFEISKELGPVLKELWKAFKKMMGALWSKIQDWWKNIDWSEVFRKSKPALIAAIGTLFGPAVWGAVKTGVVEAFKIGIDKAMKGGLFKGGFGKFGKGMGAAGGAALAVTAALGVSNGLEKFQSKMKGDFTQAERKMGAAAAGIIDTITFGLIPEDLGVVLAEGIANASKQMFKAIEDYFGKSFSDELQIFMNEWVDMAGSAGDLIKAVFSGDKDQLESASKDFGDKLFKFLKTALWFTITKLPGALLQVMKDVGKTMFITLKNVLFGIFDGLADAFEGVPILGWLVKGVTTALKFVIDLSGKIASGLMAIFGGILKGLRNYKDQVVETMKNVINAIASIFKKETWVNLAKQIVAGIKDGLSNLGETMKKPFKDAYTGITSYLGISSPSKLFAGIGSDMMSGLKNGVESNTPENIFTSQSEKFSGDYKKMVKDVMSSFSGHKAGSISMGKLVEFDTKDTTASKAISKMVASANAISKELSGIDKVNLKPKLENLGKVLGLKGSESLRIEHENFNVDINVTVELDPNKLADAIVDTGKVVKSTKAPRK